MLHNINETGLYDLNLHDELQVTDDTYALRVPGGWVYVQYYGDLRTSCFVPEPQVEISSVRWEYNE